MKKSILRFTAWAALLSLAQAMFAEGIPNGYYNNADGKSGKQLKVALGEIARNHTVLSYSSLWSHYEVTDVVLGTTKQVFDYYSPDVYYFPGNGSAPAGANKEHACPQSWWGKGNSCNCYSDLFNVMPSEEKANSAKSNYPLGTTGSPSFSNGRIKVGNSNRGAYSGKIFEPADEHKGDFARIYFYVATCYANANWQGTNCAFNKEDFPTIKSWILDLLLKWNADDPVDDWEITRQERVFGEQKNRNPFIDYPQLADHIWGDLKDVAFDFATEELHGGATGEYHPGEDPGDEPGVDPGDDPSVDPGTDPGTDPGIIDEGALLLSEGFDEIEAGNDNDNNGSSSAWSGNDNFPDVNTCYQAGGAVRMGKSKGNGSMTSRSLANASGVNIAVEVAVKGWTSVEGDLVAEIEGCPEQSVSYTATMSDSYQKVYFVFENCPANAKLTLKTSDRRAFISSVRVSIAASDAIMSVSNDASSAVVTYDLLGHRRAGAAAGLCVREGKVVLIR